MSKREDGKGSALEGFHEPVRAWFSASFQEPTRAQSLGWPVIRSGESALILAPTGSGKTLAAFLAAIDRLMFDPVPPKDQRCRALYISPLKALAVDVERNLRAPLVGITRCAERMGLETHQPEIAIRTGDTPARERAQFQRNPADILITTPESLYLLLTSNAREALRGIQTVIVDEVHALAGSKRGVHLSVTLERLEALLGRPVQRIGLSATVNPKEEVARFLGGFREVQQAEAIEVEPAEPESLLDSEVASILDEEPPPVIARSSPVRHFAPRPVQIVDAGSRKELDLCVEVPVEDMAKLGQPVEIPSGNAAQGEVRTSIWPAIHPMVLELIRQHRSTLIFVNARRLAERMAAALNELSGETIVHAHHGSIAREQRALIEDELKSGRLPAMVATSTLELGIDMGAIDLVIQVEAPPSVASGLQRIGRAGHHVGVPSKGIIIPKYRGDLLACAALTERMAEGAVESIRYPRNPLDVLAQQIVAMVSLDGWSVGDLEAVIRRAAPYQELPAGLMEETLDMLSGRYPSDEFAELRPRITWDRLNGTLHAREGARRIAITEGGTIPNRGLFGVYLLGAEKGQGRVGELDEEMVLESHPGEIFLLGASSWRIEEITHDRVIVTPAPGEPGKMPFWHGESAGRPLEFGRAIGRLCREVRALPRHAALARLTSRHSLHQTAAENLMQYLDDQAAGGVVPDDRTLVVESYRDEMGDWRVCILSPFGGKVHAPWAMALAAQIRERTEIDVDVIWTDDGMVVRFPESDEPPPLDAVIPDPDEVEDLVIRQLGSSGSAREASGSAITNALFASRFREAAARALLLPRRHPGQRAPLWQQRKRAADLLRATSRYGSFPIILETYRECLKDVFDMPALIGLLRDIRSRQLRVVPVNNRVPSPFAASLMFNYVANLLYEGDSPLAERRALALTVDPAQLRELLGEGELRELLDEEALEQLEAQLQHLSPERKARHSDGVHDMLLRLGDLTAGEVRARCSPAESGGQPDEWLAALLRQRRIVRLPVAGEERHVAAEDAGRYRDALGIPPPPGLPEAFLEYSRDPLGELCARYARTHGPFTTEQVAHRFGIGPAQAAAALRGLAQAGRVLEGEFRPGGAGREWCDAGVLRALRQKSLARLRREVEPVEQAALGRLYLAWQGIQTRSSERGRWNRSPGAASPRRASSSRDLLSVIEQLQGASIPASEMESRILPARIPDYDPRSLDLLLASGQVIWMGREPLGQNDGRISLYLTEHAPLLLPEPAAQLTVDSEAGGESLDSAIRAFLAQRGASFFPQIVQALGAFGPEAQEALWDLVWSGQVTNDTLQPLRAYLNPRRSLRRERGRAPERRTGRTGFGPYSALSSSRSTWRPAAPRPAAPEVSGRWSLVSHLVFAAPSPTERASALAGQLLARCGVVTREAVQSEGISGGFSSVYPVLKAMEEAGRVRRGYFVSGLGATQFAEPGAVDRLRAVREAEDGYETAVLAATDPANPYGAALPWPGASEPADAQEVEPGGSRGARRPMRQTGAIVALVNGALAGWMGRSERRLLTFLENVPDRDPQDVAFEIARALAAEVAPGRRRALFIEEVDGRPTHESPMASALIDAGFARTIHGFLKRI